MTHTIALYVAAGWLTLSGAIHLRKSIAHEDTTVRGASLVCVAIGAIALYGVMAALGWVS